MFRILVVEDDLRFQNLVVNVLEKAGYFVRGAKDPEEALNFFDEEVYDMVISDIMMPKMDGFSFAKLLRDTSANLPILFVTARDTYEDKEKGFDMGIDDYMVKPIDVNELVLRVKALLRRAKIANDHQLQIGSTSLDYDSLTVTTPTKQWELPQKEFLLLFKLLSTPNKIYTRAQFMDEFWGMYTDSIERTVDVHITRLREKFKNNPDFEIVTVRGLGYKAVIKNETKG